MRKITKLLSNNHSEKPKSTYGWLLKISDAFFPSINELFFIVAAATVFTVFVLDGSVARAFFEVVIDDARALIFPIAAIILVTLMIPKRKLSEDAKLWACFLYYGLFAILAISALEYQTVINNPSLFEAVNIWLTRIVLVLSILRGLAAVILFRSDDPKVNKLLTQNYKDTQYRLPAFLLAIVLAVCIVVILRSYYADSATIVVLGYFYTSIALNLLLPILNLYYKHPSKKTERLKL